MNYQLKKILFLLRAIAEESENKSQRLCSNVWQSVQCQLLKPGGSAPLRMNFENRLAYLQYLEERKEVFLEPILERPDDKMLVRNFGVA